MNISVCIASVRPTTLDAAIQSIRRQTWDNWELIIVGQGTDQSPLRAACEAASAGDPRIRYIHLTQLGKSLAWNAAMAAATGDVFALTDDDCEAREDWLEALAASFEAEPGTGVVGGALVSPPWPRGLVACPAYAPVETLYDPVADGRRAPKGWGWTGANFALRRSVAEAVGGFDCCIGPGTSFFAAEDTDYLLRLEAANVVMRSTPRSVVYHTYGMRRGWRAVYNHSRNYATGNGALAAKLTLMGDPRGREWLIKTRRECTVDVLKSGRPHRLPFCLLRLRHFTRAYFRCLRDFQYDSARGVLLPRDAPAVVPLEALA